MFLVVLINVMIWAAVIFFLFEGKKVRYEMNAGGGKIVLVVFFALGVMQYFAHPNLSSLVTMLSLTMAGIVYSLIPSGVCREGLMIIGRLYRFDKIDSIEYIIDHGRLEVNFIYKHRTFFLFKEKECEDEVRKVIKAYQKEAKK